MDEHTLTDTGDIEVPGVGFKQRDAANTRQLLLASARRRFALDGYSSTKVRDIAADAGVNVALINRYFVSKEGLFEACLARTREELDRAETSDATFDDLLQSLAQQVAGPPNGDRTLQLLLLLRSSGDEKADRIRLNTLRYFAEQMAMAAGWSAGETQEEGVMLRAEIALSTMLGIALLRSSSTGLEPLTSAGAVGLNAPLSDVVTALLKPPSVNGV